MDYRNKLGILCWKNSGGVIMIKEEYMEVAGMQLVRRYSDANKYIIRNDGKKFSEAIDLVSKGYTYTESDEDIPEVPVAQTEGE